MDKSKLKDALKLIKEAFSTVEVKFTDAKLQDGTTVIRFDAPTLDIGVSVTVITEQGELPIPDGDYILQDGTAFTTMNGLVAEVSTAAEENADSTEGSPAPAANTQSQPSAMTDAQTKAVKSIVESITKETYFSLDEKFKSLEKSFNDFVEASKIEVENKNKVIESFKAENDTLKTNFKKAVELMEKSLDIPNSEPTEIKKKSTSIKEMKAAFKADLDNLTNEFNKQN